MATHYIITNREVSTHSGKNFLKVNEREYLRTDGKEEARDELRFGTVSFDIKKKNKYKIELFEDFDDDELKTLTLKSEAPKKDRKSFFRENIVGLNHALNWQMEI